MNKVSIMGRLCSDPELRRTPNDVSVTTFAVAVSRAYVKQGEERQTDFIDIVAWRNTAEFICGYFKKGQMIAVDGKLQTRNYKDREGGNRKAVEVIADNVFFCGVRPGNKNFEPSQNDDFTVIEDTDDLPF